MRPESDLHQDRYAAAGDQKPERTLATPLCLVAEGIFGVDPYLNTDAGTMSPFEHGEVFVLDDGGEVSDLVPVE